MAKVGLILHTISFGHPEEMKASQEAIKEKLAVYQLVGEVKAHQGYDG